MTAGKGMAPTKGYNQQKYLANDDEIFRRLTAKPSLARSRLKKWLFTLLFPVATFAAPPESFFSALHHVETSGRHGAIMGDSGQALGPLQIHFSYWHDSGVGGSYSDCQSLAYSKRVVAAYMKRFAPNAWKRGDWRTLARVHNSGPQGHKKRATLPYLRKVEAAMKRLNAY